MIDAHIDEIRSEAETVLTSLGELPTFGETANIVGPGMNWQTRWTLYPFILMHQRLESRIYTPVTSDVVGKIPGVVNALFSILPPHTSLARHRGTSRALARCHVGLVTPQDSKNCYFVIDGHRHDWQVGSKLIFDQTFEHAAINETDEDRLILIVDVVRAELPVYLRWPVSAVTHALVFHPEARYTIGNYRKALASLGPDAGA
jgi:beta-hydroxylase